MCMTLKDIKEMLIKADGYRVWDVDGNDDYFHFSTPNGNIMTACKAYWGNGTKFTLNYKANRNSGTGCSCHNDTCDWDFGLTTVAIEDIEELEKAGLKYARELKAPMYRDIDEWLEYERRFWKDRIKEVA